MELRQLRYFKAVVNAGSFSEAAVQLGRTQQAVSKSIAVLEAEVGGAILKRSSQGVTPTRMGKLLLQHAETIERQVLSFSEQLSLIRHSAQGKLTVGSGAGAAQSLLPQVAAFLFENHPLVSLEVCTGIIQDMLVDLLTGELDLIVSIEVEEICNSDIYKEVLCSEKFCIVVAKGHPVLEVPASSFQPKQLLDYPWVFGRNLGDLMPEIVNTLLLDGVPLPEHVTYTNSIEFSVGTLQTTPALTILPKRMIQSHLDQGTLETVCEGRYCWQRPLTLVYSKNLDKSPALLSAINCLRQLTQ